MQRQAYKCSGEKALNQVLRNNVGDFLDLGEKISGELARKYGFLPEDAKQISSFVKSLHSFSRYLGANKYYSG